ncbi:SH3 and cysteine-rich domain-containing protein [Chelonia mydas]|uniref:SH3 and cysteine-rich domain-containing protein n=1 Tax=Chelonia mydas TaxID=8469 RepID=M7BR41_CHEMY|nr:SH3 and cysteine-rich domain-containing protein [Chelonia mydas]
MQAKCACCSAPSVVLHTHHGTNAKHGLRCKACKMSIHHKCTDSIGQQRCMGKLPKGFRRYYSSPLLIHEQFGCIKEVMPIACGNKVDPVYETLRFGTSLAQKTKRGSSGSGSDSPKRNSTSDLAEVPEEADGSGSMFDINRKRSNSDAIPWQACSPLSSAAAVVSWVLLAADGAVGLQTIIIERLFLLPLCSLALAADSAVRLQTIVIERRNATASAATLLSCSGSRRCSRAANHRHRTTASAATLLSCRHHSTASMEPAQITAAVMSTVNTSRIILQHVQDQNLQKQVRRRQQRSDESDEDMDTDFSQSTGPGNLDIMVGPVYKDTSQMHAYVALYKFVPQENEDLEMRPGDMITLLEDSNEDWWKGRIEDRIGFFPANFVQRVQQDEKIFKCVRTFIGCKEQGQITLKENQICVTSEKEHNGFIKVYCGKKKGFVPLDVLEII